MSGGGHCAKPGSAGEKIAASSAPAAATAESVGHHLPRDGPERRARATATATTASAGSANTAAIGSAWWPTYPVNMPGASAASRRASRERYSLLMLRK